jgi:hypothetical protein
VTKKSPLYWFRSKLCEFQRCFRRCKVHFYIALGAAVFGVLLAVFKNYSVYEVAKNFIYDIRLGVFNPVGMGFLILLFTTLLYTAGFLASLHRTFFFVFGYGSIALSSYFLWRSAFIAVAVNGFYGGLYLVFFVTPVFLLNLFWFSLALAQLYITNGFMKGKLSSINFACQFRIFFPFAKLNYIRSLILNFTLWAFICIFAWII